jgi:elongation factor P
LLGAAIQLIYLRIEILADTSDFKNGLHINLDGDVYTIVEFQHVKPGKGGAFVRTTLKKVKTGKTLEKTFRAGEKIETVFVEKKTKQFLYRQGNELVLMDMDTYEQEPIDASALGDQAKYLKEEMEIQVLEADGEALGYEIPNFLELEVVETDPGFKGDTVSGSTKPAKLETGATVNVPFHINIGDIIKVDTRTDTYLERVKK